MNAKNAKDLAKLAMLKVPATDHLAEAQNAKHYAEILIEKKLWMPALNYMSHAIPAREGIWWGWYCARKAMLEEATDEILHALGLAEKWIAQPNEENRMAAKDYSERIRSGSPAQCVLEAIAFIGEIEDPVSGAKSPAIPYMSAKFIAAAVVGASYFPDPEQPEVAAGEYLQQSFVVATRINLWSQYS